MSVSGDLDFGDAAFKNVVRSRELKTPAWAKTAYMCIQDVVMQHCKQTLGVFAVQFL